MLINLNRLITVIKPYFSSKDLHKTYMLLQPFVMRNWKAYIVLLLLLFLDIFLTIAFAWLFGRITDAAVKADFVQVLSLVPYGIIFVSFSIMSTYLSIYYSTVSSNGIKRDLKNHLFKHILRLPTSRASHLRSGELLSHFSNDINSIDGLIGPSLINLIRLPIVFIAVLVYLININLTLSLLSLMVAPIALIGGAAFGILLRKNSRLIHKLIGEISNHLNETFQGFSVIRSFTLEKRQFNSYAQRNEELYHLELKNSKLQGWYYSGGQIIGSVTFYFSLILGAYYVSEDLITVGSLLTFVNLVNYLVYPLSGMAGHWAAFQRSLTAIERLLNVLDQPLETHELPGYKEPIQVSKSIEFNNVCFRYDENKNIFQNFNLSIPSGKTVALVGPSGAGKSTVFNLLQSFYIPQSGSILIDGTSTEEFTLSKLRSTFAHVSQETFLFAGTIRENLMIAKTEINPSDLIDACVDAKIHDFIQSLPKGYDTEIGERGILLSGGQKQRLAIARAILKDAPILLLDEATSALDSETEFHVKEALDKLKKGRTTVVIAHRLSTILDADLIYVMDDGRIIQEGTHGELMNQIGLYKRLYQTFHDSRGEQVIVS